jgi:hypothetical protein
MTQSIPSTLRYVVLRHEGVDQPHFDLLFETFPGSMLKTWRLESWPVREVQEAQPIRDHRPAFLTYQGTLTGDRGHVMRVDEGTCTAEIAPRRVVVRLSPSNEQLLFEQDAGADTWHVRVTASSPE